MPENPNTYTSSPQLGQQQAYNAGINEAGSLQVLQQYQQAYGVGIQLPFNPDETSPLGIKVAYSTAQAIQADIINLLLTHKGERLGNPEFGSNIHRFLFEENTPELAKSIEQDVRDTMAYYTTAFGSNNGFGVEIQEINVERHDEDGNIHNKITVEIKYTVAGNTADIIAFVMGGGTKNDTNGNPISSPFSSHVTTATQLSNIYLPEGAEEPEWINDGFDFDTL